jgi:hypothetical protein
MQWESAAHAAIWRRHVQAARPTLFGAAVLHVRRVKNGTPSTPLRGDELRALRRLQRESEASPFVFVSERGSPFTTAGVARMIERAAASAGLELKAHPRLFRTTGVWRAWWGVPTAAGRDGDDYIATSLTMAREAG